MMIFPLSLTSMEALLFLLAQIDGELVNHLSVQKQVVLVLTLGEN
jgi:hypothetical protein